MEIRKDIEWLDWQYQVSNYGNIRSLKRWRKISKINPRKDHWWYLIFKPSVHCKRCDKKVHRVVAEAFIPKVKWKNEVNHKDWNKENNRVENLERCNRKENVGHEFSTWLRIVPKWWKHRGSKKCACIKDWIIIKVYDCMSDVQRELWIKVPNIISAIKYWYICHWYNRTYIE